MKLKHKLIIGFLSAMLIAVCIGYLAPIYFIGWNVLFILFLVLILSLIWGIYFSHQILKPFTELQKVFSEIYQGNLSKRIIVKSHDEIGQLCLIFNDLVNKLQEQNQLLESKTRERTGEIEVLKASLEKKVSERTEELEKIKINLEKTVDERTGELHEKIAALEKLNRTMVDRELRMIELKKEIEEFKNKTAQFSTPI